MLRLLIILLLPCCLLRGQNLLDSEFSSMDCQAQKASELTQGLAIAPDGCRLLRWKSIGAASPRIVEANGETLIQLNNGHRQKQPNGRFALYREYLQADFAEPLEAGIWYRFTAETKAHPKATVGTNDLYAYFGKKVIPYAASPFDPLPLRPQLRPGEILTPFNQLDYYEWISIEKYYKATGDEKFIIIGNFNKDLQPFVNISRKVLSDEDNPKHNELLIRNIRLEKIPPPANYENEVPDKLQPGDKITLSNITFASGNAQLESQSMTIIQSLSEVLQSNELNIEIIGHTDDRGTAEANLALSKKRAIAVLLALNKNGIDMSRLKPIGKGEAEPVADNATEAGRKLNRRVEFNIQ